MSSPLWSLMIDGLVQDCSNSIINALECVNNGVTTALH